MTRIQTSNELRLAFNFTNSDLQDNRQCFMSYRQKRWLWLKALLKGEWLSAFIVLTIILSIGYGIATFIASGFRQIFFGNDELFLTIAIVCLLLSIYGFPFLIIGWKHLPSYYHDVRAGKVSSIQIEINTEAKRGFSVFGGEACVKLSPTQLAHLQNNYTYRLYYAPKTCEILSIEIVRVDKGAKDMPASDNVDVAEAMPTT